MYRLHPQTAKLVELISAGTIGEVRMIKSSFGFAMPASMLRTASMPTNSPAAASSMSAAIRSRWRG